MFSDIFCGSAEQARTLVPVPDSGSSRPLRRWGPANAFFTQGPAGNSNTKNGQEALLTRRLHRIFIVPAATRTASGHGVACSSHASRNGTRERGPMLLLSTVGMLYIRRNFQKGRRKCFLAVCTKIQKKLTPGFRPLTPPFEPQSGPFRPAAGPGGSLAEGKQTDGWHAKC